MRNNQLRNQCKICRSQVGLVAFGGTHICSECLGLIKEYKLIKVPVAMEMRR